MFAGSTAKDVTRPEATAGPRERKRRPWNVSLGTGPGCTPPGSCATAKIVNRNRQIDGFISVWKYNVGNRCFENLRSKTSEEADCQPAARRPVCRTTYTNP